MFFASPCQSIGYPGSFCPDLGSGHGWKLERCGGTRSALPAQVWRKLRAYGCSHSGTASTHRARREPGQAPPAARWKTRGCTHTQWASCSEPGVGDVPLPGPRLLLTPSEPARHKDATLPRAKVLLQCSTSEWMGRIRWRARLGLLK